MDGAEPTSDGGHLDGGEGQDAAGDGSVEAGDAASEASEAGTTYPAFAPDLPQIMNNGGAILTHPLLVTVTWQGDPNASYYQAFGDGLGSSMYWNAAESSYGIGTASSGPSDHVTVPGIAPSTLSSEDVVNLIVQSVEAASWPAPTSDTMYLIYPPEGTTLELGNEPFCGGAYHDSIPINGVNVAYAAMATCAGGTNGTTLAASHEIGEGSADPFPSVTPAYLGYDQPHFAWLVMQAFQEEIADACEFYTSARYDDTEPGFAFTVQRIWSNQSAALGHNPCQPADTPVYYNTTLLAPEDITVDDHSQGGSTQLATKGIRILPGQTKTFPIGFYSDGPTSGPWTIIAHSQNPVATGTPANNGQMTVSLDNATGQNGDVAHLTVTVTSAGDMNSELIVIESRLGVEASHFYPILIGSQ